MNYKVLRQRSKTKLLDIVFNEKPKIKSQVLYKIKPNKNIFFKCLCYLNYKMCLQ